MPRPAATEKRRELALRAVEVLQHEGLELSMTQLADALDVKRPTLLYHFPTRAHIVELALEDLLREQTAFVLGRIRDIAHPIDRVYAQLQAMHEFHRGREARIVFLSQAIAAAGGSRMNEIIDVGNRVFQPYRRAAVELVREGVAAGTVADCDAEALVAVIRALTDGLLVQRVMTGVALEPIHEFLWNHLLAPLKRPKETT